jgi:hypothetical protein
MSYTNSGGYSIYFGSLKCERNDLNVKYYYTHIFLKHVYLKRTIKYIEIFISKSKKNNVI